MSHVHTNRLEAALDFFTAHMLGPHKSKVRAYRKAGIEHAPTTAKADWHALAALLTGDLGERTSLLAELPHHHVRAACMGGFATYTFVQEAVEEEYEAFQGRYHLVFSHEPDLSRVEVRRLRGAQWVEYAEEHGGIEFFAFSRFTDPEIEFPSQWINEHGDLMLVVEDGTVVYLDPALWEYGR